MSGAEVSLALSVFLACAVEAVEATTIVLAVGSTRSWRSAGLGVGAALAALAVIVAAMGPALTALPIDLLHLVVGALLLVFGLQWLRKAILRAAGAKDKHDEEAIFAACAVEGVEAVTIVLAAGLTRGWRSAAAGVGAALVVLAVIVAALGPALTVLPIGALRLLVGGLLLVFGLQWLRKAILRAAGLKALHDESEIYARQATAAHAASSTGRSAACQKTR